MTHKKNHYFHIPLNIGKRASSHEFIQLTCEKKLVRNVKFELRNNDVFLWCEKYLKHLMMKNNGL